MYNNFICIFYIPTSKQKLCLSTKYFFPFPLILSFFFFFIDVFINNQILSSKTFFNIFSYLLSHPLRILLLFIPFWFTESFSNLVFCLISLFVNYLSLCKSYAICKSSLCFLQTSYIFQIFCLKQKLQYCLYYFLKFFFIYLSLSLLHVVLWKLISNQFLLYSASSFYNIIFKFFFVLCYIIIVRCSASYLIDHFLNSHSLPYWFQWLYI